MAQQLDFYFSASVASAQHFHNTVIERESKSLRILAYARRKAEILRFRGKIFTEYVLIGERPRQPDSILVGTGPYEEIVFTGETY